MKLRHTIRPPVRYSDEIVYSPGTSPRRMRKDNMVKDPHYIDYVPNQRPAAFPTRDFARASPQNGNAEDRSRQNIQRNGRKGLESSCSLTGPENHDGNSLYPGLEGIPADQLDNYIASNGDLNPIWVSNMAKMAAPGKNFPNDAMDVDVNMGYAAYEAMVLDMEDTDVDGTISETPGVSSVDSDSDESSSEEASLTSQSQPSSTGPRDPSWSDLSRRMQAEILENLLERYSRRSVCRMLGLTAEESSAIKELIRSRREQEKLEDTVLKAMREKQLREFMKIDNSLRNPTQSPHLGFQKASRQAFRKLDGLIHPDVNFFACEKPELTAARRFLRKREIEAKFAGAWGNEIGCSRPSKNGGGASSKMVGLDGGPGPNPVEAICLTSNQAKVPSTCSFTTATATKPPTIRPQLASSTVVKQGSTASLGESPTSSSSEFQELNRDLTTPAKLLTLRNKGKLDNERDDGEKEGPQQIDLDGCQDLSVSDLTLGSSPCPKNAPLPPSFEKLALKQPWQSLDQQQSANTIQRTNSCLINNLTLLSKTAENGNSDLEHDVRRLNSERSPQRPRPSVLLRSDKLSNSTQEPGGTKQYTENQRSCQNQTFGDNMESHTNSRLTELNLTGVVKPDTLIPVSPSSTPTDHIGGLSSSSETRRFRFSTPPSPETVRTHPPSPSTSASCGTHTGDEDEDEAEDDELLEDEVVLVPIGPRGHP